MDTVDYSLAHYGVKGMKWGKRKSRPTGPVEVSTKITPGKRVKTEGGQGLSPHDDAIRVAVSKQKAKKSSTDSLSTKELQEMVNRMNLEKQYSTLQAQSNNGLPGQKFARELITGVGKQQAQRVANDYATVQVASILNKKGAK